MILEMPYGYNCLKGDEELKLDFSSGLIWVVIIVILKCECVGVLR